MAHIGHFVGHQLGGVGAVPAVAKKAAALGQVGGVDEAAHDVGTRVVAVVNACATFELRRRGQQNEAALHAVDEEIAPAIEKTHRAQRFDDELLHLFWRAVLGLACVNGLGYLHRRIDLLDQAAAQDLFGALAQKFHVAHGRLHFRGQALLLLLGDDVGHALERGTLLAFVAPCVKRCQCQRDHQNQCQCADQVQPGHGGFIGGKMHAICVKLLAAFYPSTHRLCADVKAA